MKKIFLISSLLLSISITNSYAIDSGTYFCKESILQTKFQIILKKSGRVVMLGRRGNWKDYGDEATLIETQTVLTRVTEKGIRAYVLTENGFKQAVCVDKNSPYLKNMK